jgi:predicted ATPase/DNA-binding SARP family transcriptional activator
MEFRVLGPLEVWHDGELVVVGSRMERVLLAALLVNANAVVATTGLIEALWGEEPPPSERNSLQTYVARLRRRLGRPGAAISIVTRPPGYLLQVDPRRVDALRFEELLGDARRLEVDQPAQALGLLDEALELWRGPAFAEFADQDVARAEAVRLDELRETATDQRIEALCAVGRMTEAVAALEATIARRPLAERPHAQLMGALARSGRQVEALRLYQRYRDRLAAEVGLEPSVELRSLEGEILRQAPHVAPSHPQTSSPTRLGNLPGQATSFVGRENEVAELVAVLERARVVTLVGPGGVGKTRLALRVAGEIAAGYSEGIYIVELASVASPEAVVHAVAGTLGVRRTQGRTLDRAVADFLRGRRLLLVIDNCEHVLDAAAELVQGLVRRCPDLTVIATSRERLTVEGEHTWPVPPLAVPGRVASQADVVQAAPAAALFVDRARAARPDFRLDDGTAKAVAAICRGLDGLPLAVELAAARLPALTVDDLADRLSERFTVLTAGRRADHARHRTLEAVVDWSYGLLDEGERMVFERLSVFAAGWTLDQAASVCAGDGVPAGQVVDLVANLVNKSMVVGPAVEGTGRYALLETLRHYGAARLAARGDDRKMRRAHAECFLAFAEHAGLGLAGSHEREWVERLGAELDNLRVAHRWCRQHDQADLALRLSAALHRFACWQVNDEILTWAAAAVELPSARGHPMLPIVHGSAGLGAWRRGDLTAAVRHAQRGLAASAGPDDPARALPFEVLADVWSFSGRLDEAFDAYGEAIRLGRLGDDHQTVVYGLVSQALARAYGGDLRTASALVEELHQEAVAVGNPTATAWSLYARGESLLDEDPDRALALLDKSLDAATSANNVFITGVALLSATSIRGRHGEPRQALRSYLDAINHWHQLGNWTQQWITLRNLIDLLARVGADEPAAELYGATASSATAPPTFGPEAQRLHAVIAELTRRLGQEAADEATQRGATLSDDEVVDLATTTIEHTLEGGPEPPR